MTYTTVHPKFALPPPLEWYDTSELPWMSHAKMIINFMGDGYC